MAVAILAAAAVQVEASRRIERARRIKNGSVRVNMISMWVFGAVLTLPLAWVAVVTVLLSAHDVLRSGHGQRSFPHRKVMNAAAMVLAAWTARLVLDAGGVPVLAKATQLAAVPIVVVAVAALVFFAVDCALIAVSLLVDDERQRSVAGLFGSADDNALELATICLGAVIGLVLVYQPIALVFLFVPLFVLHRGVLVTQFKELATKDQKTGLLNAATWREVAARELTTADTAGVLMVDLDHFKRVNDTHGHLAGDEVLKAVAATVRRSVRDYDSVGRFGGEEFVVLLPGLTSADVLAIAERIRRAVADLRVPLSGTVLSTLSASIGVATYPSSAAGIDELVHAADTALYRAKRGGRNRVVSSLTVCDTRTG
ncbi:GGDEF domain-containing protein [Kutzneria sp. CA-103260]|uniref:GGDEF domain-containing protein n=1 Tax=Kutzneria sp. CA-103260 TaxID=2802641 RepID=UPI001BAD6484|nr:GGDEF domain-containing protein [Kutzneria sp. CA-103260]